MDYDDLLKLHIGEFGRYQRLVVVLVALTCVPGVINSLNIVFLAAVPDHLCHSPSAAHLNLSREDLLHLTTPTKDQQCSQYDQNYSDWTPEQARENKTFPENLTVVNCQSGWDYDNSTYQSTIVTQWNLVCDKKALVPTAASIFMAGMTLGVMICGYLSDRYGRKVVCIGCSILMVVFAMAIPFSPNYMTFVALRFFLGMPTFGLIMTALVLAIEMVGPSRRVLAGTFVWFCWPLGYIIIAATSYGLRRWKDLALALAVPQLLVLFSTFIIPESPRWLYSKGKGEKAERIVRKMAKMNRVNISEKVKVTVVEHSTASVWDLFRYRKLRQRTLILFFIWFANSVVYYGLSLNTSNLGGSDHVNFFIAGAVEFPALVFYQLSSEYLGRRKTTTGTMVVGGLSLLCIAAVPKDLKTVIITLAMVGKFCITVSFNLIYIFSAEMYPTVVRNVGVSSGSFWARVGSIIAPYIGSLMELNRVIPYIMLGVLSITAGLLALILPETKGQQLPETIEDGENFPKPTSSVPETVKLPMLNPSQDEPH